eukprot:NODE_13120_length_1184_cov_3.263955.p1 GENE.NODE_13120_length_1184_cov_3.263955~~NODE_13120_length_1184_cov_3.263955.p1  ORF type:complete len:339 (-),score=39.95 NODE_13120_length_1184_cov_3.263955:43-1059(-)
MASSTRHVYDANLGRMVAVVDGAPIQATNPPPSHTVPRQKVVTGASTPTVAPLPPRTVCEPQVVARARPGSLTLQPAHHMSEPPTTQLPMRSFSAAPAIEQEEYPIIEVPKPVFVWKSVEVPTIEEVVVEVPVYKIVKRTVEVPQVYEIIVEVPETTYVERRVEVDVYEPEGEGEYKPYVGDQPYGGDQLPHGDQPAGGYQPLGGGVPLEEHQHFGYPHTERLTEKPDIRWDPEGNCSTLAVLFLLPNGNETTVYFTHKPLGLTFPRKVPLQVAAVEARGDALQKGVQEGWVVLRVNGMELPGQAFEEDINLLRKFSSHLPKIDPLDTIIGLDRSHKA